MGAGGKNYFEAELRTQVFFVVVEILCKNWHSLIMDNYRRMNFSQNLLNMRGENCKVWKLTRKDKLALSFLTCCLLW